MKDGQLRPIDVDIIRCLQDDTRSSYAKIAARLRVPESTVRHRLNRLIKDGVVEFATLTNPLHMGYQIWVLIDIQTELHRARAIAAHIAEAPEVYWVGVTTGTRNLHVGAVFRSNKELVDFMSGWLCKVKGIVATTTTSILELTKRKWTIGVPDDMVGKGPRGARRRLPRQGRR
jgi:Lrp/AsnC family transcriptional regulator for asnA, asnC and gidA